MKIILTLIAFFASMGLSLANDIDIVRSGKLDLRKWEPAKQKLISLDGEWAFAWESLLGWEEMMSGQRSFAQFSKPWNEQLIDEVQHPRNGYATYAVEVLLPEHISEISLLVPAVFNSYVLYVNDQEVCSNGVVSTDRETTVPEWKPQSVTLTVDDHVARIIFQIANFRSTRGGSAEIIKMSSGATMAERYELYKLSGTIALLIFLLAAVVGMITYYLSRQQNVLFFALLSLAFVLRFLFSDLYLFHDLIPTDISWQIAARIEYITIPFIIIWGILFISGKYPSEFKRAAKVFFLTVNLFFIPLILIVSSDYFSQILIVIQITSIAFLVYSIIATAKALMDKRTGAWMSTFGIAIFVLIGIYNIVALMTGADLNRIVMHLGYTLALILNAIALFYRTPDQIASETSNTLSYDDLYK